MAHSHDHHHHHHSGNILVKIATVLHLPGFTHDHSHGDLACLTPAEFEEEWNKCPP